jgi:hypothetical protein
MEGSYKVKSPDLKRLHEKAVEMIGRLDHFSIEHVRREQNREADRLANEALDAGRAGRGLTRNPTPAPTTSSIDSLHASGTYRAGVLKLDRELPLTEGEEVDLQIRRRR